MKISHSKLKGCVIIEPHVFGDERGFFLETFQAVRYEQVAGIDLPFVQDNHSKSNKGTLRGLHFQKINTQGKLVRVISGEVYDVAVDLRKNSSTFGEWVGEYLSAENKRQLWIPEGFAHGFICLSKNCTVNYKCSNYRNPKYEKTLAWNDPKIKIKWPIKKPILSDKDKYGLNLNSFLF